MKFVGQSFDRREALGGFPAGKKKNDGLARSWEGDEKTLRPQSPNLRRGDDKKFRRLAGREFAQPQMQRSQQAAADVDVITRVGSFYRNDWHDVFILTQRRGVKRRRWQIDLPIGDASGSLKV